MIMLIESHQGMASGSSGDSNVCVLLHTGNGQDTSANSQGQAHIVWSWQAGTSATAAASSRPEECSEFTQSTINMRDLE